MGYDFNVLVDNLKNKYGNDPGVFDIFWADRFGSEKVVVRCISKEDRKRLIPLLTKEYNLKNLYISFPIWSIGGIIPEYGKKIEEMIRNDLYMTEGTTEHDIYNKYQAFVVEEEENRWKSWTKEQRLQFIRQWIKKERKKDPKFGNCADKFLV